MLCVLNQRKTRKHHDLKKTLNLINLTEFNTENLKLFILNCNLKMAHLQKILNFLLVKLKWLFRVL